uniref:Protein kinase domain-containing protein n=1 Tax=Pinguiococcus pyrenoidosus TaxID=172671 RepID=A0A7R9U2F5_9STRA|mmetsp:Transcript_11962/g.44463  ORF Transcript_11962/g.44463 Transcript_11962/m.44463 type:complete len:521 (+) Transcript_11962:181-1743(+)
MSDSGTESPSSPGASTESLSPRSTLDLQGLRQYVVRDLDTGEVYALGAEDLEFDTFTSPRKERRRSSGYAQMSRAVNDTLNGLGIALSATVSGVWSFLSDGGALLFGDAEFGLYHGMNVETARLQGDDGRPGEEIRMSELGVVRTLGRGAFGQVLLVRHKPSAKEFALKIVRLQASGHITQQQLMEEKHVLEKMGRCRHPYCAALKFAFHANDSLYLGMEYLSGGDLKKHLRLHRRLPLAWVRFWVAELVLALGHLHSLDIVYRDVKPHNCILDSDGHVRIVDFGLSKQRVTDACGARTLLGTPDYAAPEVLAVGFRRAAQKREKRLQKEQKSSTAPPAGRRSSSHEISLDDLQTWRDGYGKAADWWSLGVMTYELLSGSSPFKARDVRHTYKKILFSPLKFRGEEYFHEDTRTLLNGLLEKDPADRLGSWNDIPKDIMSQPFFATIDWDLLMARKLPSPYHSADALLDKECQDGGAEAQRSAPTVDKAGHVEKHLCSPVPVAPAAQFQDAAAAMALDAF